MKTFHQKNDRGFANEIRDLLTEAIEARKVVLENEALNAALKEESLDVTFWKTNASRYTSYFDTSYGRD